MSRMLEPGEEIKVIVRVVWECRKCLELNFDDKLACRKCGEPMLCPDHKKVNSRQFTNVI
jgi:hypothetical protein